MNKTNFKKYISYVKTKRKSNIEDQYIEKDYFISLFLSTWQKLKSEEKLSYLDKLVFKGGTLLARNYLDYPRISEDIDFTYEKSNDLRRIDNENKRENEIKKIIIPIIDDIKSICNEAELDFNTDRTNENYVKVINSRAVYILNVYYKSLITGEKQPIKIEINFLEKIIHDFSELKIKNIVSQDLELKSIGYDLLNININTYSLNEIILEKYRAVLTRPRLKQRDILDLYLIHKKNKDVLKFDNELIYKKIQSAYIISPNLNKNLDSNCKLLNKGKFDDSDDDLDRLLLVEINKNDYNKFKKELFGKLETICKLGDY